MRCHYPKITLCMPTFGRPIRTRRMLDCIQAQTMNNIEFLFWGDACPEYQKLIRSEWFWQWWHQFEEKGNCLFFMNNAIGGRDWGAKIINAARFVARAPYFCIINNDDKILPEYAEFYYNSIAKTENDFVYNTTYVYNAGNTWFRHPEIKQGAIGHNEIIIKTEFLRKMPAEINSYEQDWILVQNMIAAGGKHQKGYAPHPTYYVMSTPGQVEPGMENDN